MGTSAIGLRLLSLQHTGLTRHTRLLQGQIAVDYLHLDLFLAIINLIKSLVSLLLKKVVQLANLYMKVLMRVILRVSKLVQMISPLSLQFQFFSFLCVFVDVSSA